MPGGYSLYSFCRYTTFGTEMSGRRLLSAKAKYGYQGSLKDNEISGEGNDYTTHFRALDSRLGKWFSIDPKATGYESPYVAMSDNPIIFNDIKGDEVGVDESIKNDKKANKSFEAFAKTKEGVSFLSKYAKAGQIIAGVKYDKDGEFHSKGLDLNYELKPGIQGGGETGKELKYDDKGNTVGGKITITLFKGKGWQSNNEEYNRVVTTFHESFIHADLFTADYLDNKKFDYTNITAKEKEGAGMIPIHYHHSKVRMDFVRMGYKSTNAFPSKAFAGLTAVVKSWNLNFTPLEVQSQMWNTSGGLDLDPKTGENNDGKKAK